VDPN
jgi:hypothetical protein